MFSSVLRLAFDPEASYTSAFCDSYILLSHLLSVEQMSNQMDLRNRALCFALRHPPAGTPKTKLEDIVRLKLVQKKNGDTPTIGAISEAANTYQEEKAKPGRKLGWRKTSKNDDKQIMKTFMI